ncbi:putative PurR-regulated permease PerM [Salirhabdus euzebyi]|uniref:Putative PurR-regulated permease PerM n=1 Tax=Salirhabdus euzebyi TaxID=394506 RepID=A0A841Q982_9BACI|nr:AI-2E family transporter [Salirhabdus euzebyi]MBB6454812.1 putative PurR-regulated permease PerM [Salirhabdus euzebyi]
MGITKTKWFQVSISIILFLIIVWLMNEVQFVFTPLVIFAQTLFAPFLIAGLLFYLCRPFINLLEKFKVPRKLGILTLFLIFICIFTIIISLIGPVVQKQFTNLVSNVPEMIDVVEEGITYWQENQQFIPEFVKDGVEYVGDRLETIILSTGSFIGSFLGNLIGFIISLAIVPFILFYMLSDRDKFAPNVTRFFPKSRADDIRNVLRDMDDALASYIQGQLIVSTFVGVVLYIGYLIIDLDYSLLLALFGMVTNVIPFLGPFLAVIPAIIAAWFQDPIMVLYVIIVMVVAQQAESNLISPTVMGRALNIHPLTIILLILVGGNLAGILGMILIIPTYAVSKVIVKHTYKLIVIRREELKSKIEV